jgi:tetratricopeptide (TPR) repeat protein
MTFPRIILLKLLLIWLFIQPVSGQVDRRSVRQGNWFYNAEKFTDAEIKYRRSLEENPGNNQGMFNLGNSLYRQERFDEASQAFEVLSQKAADDNKRANAFHNWGNSLLRSQDYAGSVNAYKNALRLNPGDNETRFNLAYAMQRLQEQQNQSGQGNQNQDDQNRQEQNNPADRNEQEQQQQPQPRQGQLSQQEAERILDALKQREQNLQQQISNQNNRRTPTALERNW